MLRKGIEEKHGKDWWKRKFHIEESHVIKLIGREIDEKIVEILKHGVIIDHPPPKKRRCMCIHKEPNGEYTTLIVIPTKRINFIITGFPSNPEQIEVFENERSGFNG